MKPTVIILFLLTSFSAHESAKGNASNTLHAWVYNAYSYESTINFFSTFFIFDSDTPYSKIVITPSSTFKLSDCSTPRYQLFFAPASIASIIEENCDYKTALLAIQQPVLWVVKKESMKQIGEIQKIGTIRNSPASLIVKKIPPSLIADLSYREYDYGESMLNALFQNDIDGIIVNERLIYALSPALSDKLIALHTFEDSFSANILLHNRLQQEQRTYIINSILNNESQFFIKKFKEIR